MLDEELELPRQLFDIEGDAIGRVGVGAEVLAALLHARNELHGLPVQRVMLSRCCGTEVRLERDVTEIFQPDHAKRIRMMQDRRHRHRHLRQ